jgi:hypothetical protein
MPVVLLDPRLDVSVLSSHLVPRPTFELTGFYGAQRSKNPVQRFVSP